jgi:hypothetical protein
LTKPQIGAKMGWNCALDSANLDKPKEVIILESNLLDDDLIEALECLRAWWNNYLIRRL